MRGDKQEEKTLVKDRKGGGRGGKGERRRDLERMAWEMRIRIEELWSNEEQKVRTTRQWAFVLELRCLNRNDRTVYDPDEELGPPTFAINDRVFKRQDLEVASALKTVLVCRQFTLFTGGE
eukprot:249296-Hanusia_phi.AAC.5